MPKINVICETCNISFKKYECDIRNRIFCSKKCFYGKTRDIKSKIFPCAFCEKPVSKYPHQIKNNNNQVCSSKCANLLHSKLSIEPMIGKTFNSLTVINIVPRDIRNDTYVNCLCSCGRNTEVRAVYLKNNHSKSCGKCTGSTSEERFFHYVKKDKSGCWLWTGTKNPGGYGMFTYLGKQDVSSRVSWIIHNGPIPEGLFICHTCDVRHCVNPDHLWLGTNDDNMKDMSEKLRCQYGENHFRAKLTSEYVVEIRKLASKGYSASEISPRFGVCPQTITAVLKGITWSHVQ